MFGPKNLSLLAGGVLVAMPMVVATAAPAAADHKNYCDHGSSGWSQHSPTIIRYMKYERSDTDWEAHVHIYKEYAIPIYVTPWGPQLGEHIYQGRVYKSCRRH